MMVRMESKIADEREKLGEKKEENGCGKDKRKREEGREGAELAHVLSRGKENSSFPQPD